MGGLTSQNPVDWSYLSLKLCFANGIQQRQKRIGCARCLRVIAVSSSIAGSCGCQLPPHQWLPALITCYKPPIRSV